MAEVSRHQGEWVQPGQTVLRMLRLDRLRAEGLVVPSQIGDNLAGRKATLTVEIDGKPVEFAGAITYVSPEIDPVNGQVRFWAEIDNPQLKLRPGMHGSIAIEAVASAAPAR